MHNFSKIILHSLLLIIYVIVLLFCYTLPYFHGESYGYQDYKVRKELSGSIDTIVIGSSHALRSVKPTILNEKMNIHSYNLSSPLMSMYGRYTLLKKEIKRNPVKTIYLELSYNSLMIDKYNLGYEGDLYVLGRLDNTFERLDYFKNAFTKDERKRVISDTIKRTNHSIIEKGTVVQYETLGYLPVPSNDLSVSKEELSNISDTLTFDTNIREESLNCFKKIISLCKENNVQIIIIVTPITEKMLVEYSNFDEVFSQYINLAQKYDINYYDFNLDKKRNELYDEKTSFYDESHMSDSGAEIFSNRLSKIMIDTDNGLDVSGEFFDSYKTFKEILWVIK